MMSWYGNGMGALGWLGMGVLWLILLGLVGWLPRAQRVASVQDARPGAGSDGR